MKPIHTLKTDEVSLDSFWEAGVPETSRIGMKMIEHASGIPMETIARMIFFCGFRAYEDLMAHPGFSDEQIHAAVTKIAAEMDTAMEQTGAAFGLSVPLQEPEET